MLLPIIAVIIGLVLLVWSADKFVEGAAGGAKHLGVSPLLIGMLILGFGTSAPEMVISSLASLEGKSDLALGNAIGSNISNIALILGITCVFMPIGVHSRALKKELPILTGVSLVMSYLLYDARLERLDSLILLAAFGLFVSWSVWQATSNKADLLGEEVLDELEAAPLGLRSSVLWLFAGFVVLLGSSRVLVWGAVEIAKIMGVSDLIIGLTVVAVGTSLPELASTIAAAKKGEHDIAFGNVIGSNIFNTLAVVGLAGAIHPIKVSPEVFSRDLVVMCGLTLSLFVFGFGFRGKMGRINRFEGALLLIGYVAYTSYLVVTVKASL